MYDINEVSDALNSLREYAHRKVVLTNRCSDTSYRNGESNLDHFYKGEAVAYQSIVDRLDTLIERYTR